MTAAVRRIFDSEVVLTRVVYHLVKEVLAPVCIELQFGPELRLFVAAQPDDDTLAICDDRPQGLGDASVDVSASDIWSKVVGLRPRWAWSMTNQQGYRDGFQIELSDASGDAAHTVQLIAAASTVSVRSVGRPIVTTG